MGSSLFLKVLMSNSLLPKFLVRYSLLRTVLVNEEALFSISGKILLGAFPLTYSLTSCLGEVCCITSGPCEVLWSLAFSRSCGKTSSSFRILAKYYL